MIINVDYISNLIKRNILSNFKSSKKKNIKSGNLVIRSGKLPSAKNPPRQLSKNGLEAWPLFWKKYGKIIKQSGDNNLERTWAAAIALWRKYTINKKITTFTNKGDTTFRSKDDHAKIRKLVLGNRKKLLNKMINVASSMKKAGLIKKVFKEKVKDIFYHPTKSLYRLTTIAEAPFNKNISYNSHDLIFLFKAKGFTKKKGRFTHTIGSNKIEIFPNEKGDRLLFRNVLNITRPQINSFLKTRDEHLKDKDVVIKNLKKELNKMIKEKALSDRSLKL